MRIARRLLLVCVLPLMGLCPALAGGTEKADDGAPPEAVAKWRAMKFGLFLHWGPVSLKGTELGHSRGVQVPIEEYDALYKRFNPARFDADQWAQIAKDAGVKYVVHITKHHDGFCMFDSKLIDYNIMHTPFGRDPTKELAAACRRQGLAFGLYYSVADWWHPDFPLGSPKGWSRKPNPNMDRYEQYMRGQLVELLENYGPLLTLWFDYPMEFNAERGRRVLKEVRRLQPDVLVNDRLAAPMGSAIPGDYDTPEQRVGLMQPRRAWETCMTLGTQWSWKPDDKLKPAAECIRTLVQVVGGDGNLLLDVGPMPDGRIEPRQAERLKEIGRWLAKYGESIYGTRGGPFERGNWGAATYKGDTIYLHLLDPNLDVVKLPPLERKIVQARVLTGGTATVGQTDNAIEVSVPKADRQPIDTIVAVKLDGPAAEAKCKLWDMAALAQPPKTFDDPKHTTDEVKAVFFEGLPWRGKPTRVFAYVGVPKVAAGKKVPAMVLVHGAGGSASLSWAKLWLDRGYAAISMDTGGNVPGSQWNNFTRHEHGGPPGWMGFDQVDLPPRDQVVYHAVADVILAHSLIRSLPQIDPDRVGLAGGSWGGFLTCIAAAVDQRFKFAVAVYGCGFLGVNSAWVDELRRMGPKNANYWLGLWDPSIYLRDVTMPMLWVSGTNDFAFPLDLLRESYNLPRAPRTLCIRVRMPHNQEASSTCREVHAFADAMLRGGKPLAQVEIRRRHGQEVGARFSGPSPMVNAELNYTLDTGPWQKRNWQTMPAQWDAAAGTASGVLPDGATAYYFNLTDQRGLTVSSEHYVSPPAATVGSAKPSK